MMNQPKLTVTTLCTEISVRQNRAYIKWSFLLADRLMVVDSYPLIDPEFDEGDLALVLCNMGCKVRYYDPEEKQWMLQTHDDLKVVRGNRDGQPHSPETKEEWRELFDIQDG